WQGLFGIARIHAQRTERKERHRGRPRERPGHLDLSVSKVRAYYPARASSDRDLHRRLVTQIRRKPAFHLFHGHALALGIVLDLVAIDLAEVEVARFGV